MKYELRKRPEDDKRSVFVHNTFDFTENPMKKRWYPEWTLNRHMLGSKPIALTRAKFTFGSLLFGWTRMTHEEIVACGEQTIKKYERYSFLLRNCQGFAQDLAMAITVDAEHRTGENTYWTP